MHNQLNGTIVFSSGKHGDYDIWSINLATGALRQLTHGDCWNDKPRWSPDGRSVVFVSNASGTPDIYRIDAEGGSPATPLIQNGKWNDYPAFSPNGRQLGYVSNLDGNNDLWIANADGSQPEKITRHPGADTFFSWLPDGRTVLFSSDREGNEDIYRLELGTGKLTQLTSDVGMDIHPVASPDGEFVAFVSNRQFAADRHHDQWTDRDLDVWLMRADGSMQVRVTDSQGSDRCVAWSPDGNRLIYAASNETSAAERLVVIDVRPVVSAFGVDERAVEKAAARLRADSLDLPRAALEQEIGAQRHANFLTRFLPDIIARRLYDAHYFGSERFPDWHAVGSPAPAFVTP